MATADSGLASHVAFGSPQRDNGATELREQPEPQRTVRDPRVQVALLAGVGVQDVRAGLTAPRFQLRGRVRLWRALGVVAELSTTGSVSRSQDAGQVWATEQAAVLSGAWQLLSVRDRFAADLTLGAGFSRTYAAAQGFRVDDRTTLYAPIAQLGLDARVRIVGPLYGHLALGASLRPVAKFQVEGVGTVLELPPFRLQGAAGLGVAIF